MAVVANLVVLLVHLFAYYVGKLIAAKVSGRRPSAVGPKVAGLIAVLLSSAAILAWLFSRMDWVELNALPPEQSGYIIGRVVGSLLFPTLISLAVVGYRIARARNDEAKTARDSDPAKA